MIPNKRHTLKKRYHIQAQQNEDKRHPGISSAKWVYAVTSKYPESAMTCYENAENTH